jgi:tight adherence protein C
MSRTQALRQLARRVDAPSLSSFTSALIQAEQVGREHGRDACSTRRSICGSGGAKARCSRRRRSPVKLVFPLVVCFLPGIFASTLAPRAVPDG